MPDLITRTSTENLASSTPATAAVRLLIFLGALSPLLFTPIVPTIDFYDHVARYYVLAHVGSDTFLAQNYALRWAILPNIGMDVLGTALATFVPINLLAKLIVVIIFATQYFGILYFNRQLTGRSSLLVAVLAVPLLYSFILTWGFANFLLGLGLVFWGAGWWLAKRQNLALAIPTASLWALVIFLTHGLAFGLYGLLLGGLELGLFFATRPRSIAGLARSMAALAVQAVAPAVLFRLSATIKASAGMTNADEAVARLANHDALLKRLGELAQYRLTTFARVSEGPSAAFDIATNLALLLVCLLLAFRGRLALSRPAWCALAIIAALAVVVPPALFGVGYVADRIPLFLTWIAVGAVITQRPPESADRILVALGSAIVAIKVIAIGASWAPYGADYANYEAVRRAIPPHSLVTYANFANANRLDPSPRCEMYGPLLIAGGHATPLFAIPTAQPITMIGALKEAGRASPSNPNGAPPSLERSLTRFEGISRAAAFDYVLACAPERVGVGASSQRVLVAQRGRFALFRLIGSSNAEPNR